MIQANKGTFPTIFVAILITGFLVIGTIPNLLGITESSLSVPYRIIVLGGSVLLIILTLFRKGEGIQLSRFRLFVLFWIIYGIRIIHDLYFDPILLYQDKPASEYLQFALGVVFIPACCILLYSKAIDENRLLHWLYRVLFFTLIIALYYRRNSDLSGRTVGDVNVGILLFGQFGATLSILSVYRLVAEKNTLKKKLFYLLGFIVGFVGIFVSASKSPFLALVAVLLLFLLLRRNGLKAIVLIAVASIFFNFYFVDIVSILNNYFNSNFLERLLYSIEVGGDKVRENLAAKAFSEFLDHPILGNAMLIQDRDIAGSYPHNLILEAFMATGVVGGGLFLTWIFICLKKGWTVIRDQYSSSWIALLFVQYLIFGMFSKNLYSSDLFWFFSILLMGSQMNKKASD